MTDRRAPAGRAVIIGLLLLVGISTGRSLANGFAFDDVPIILENNQVHELAPPWVYAQQSYWPPRDLGDAYRPWTIWWFGLEWAMGHGSAVGFHLVNLILTAVVTLLVWHLARALLPPFGALAAAAVFAVDPVHVEATANVVGQAELWMTGFVLVGCLVYLKARQQGLGPSLRVRLGLAGLLVLAGASKEQGIVLPGLLAVLDLAIDPLTPWRTRLRLLAPTYGLLGLTLAAFVFARFLVLGDLGGGPPAEGLAGLGLGARLAVMLPLYLHWARLLAWPATLRAQWSPPEFAGTSAWTLGATLGLGLLTGLALAAWGCRRSRPALTLGILWVAVAGSIVANLAFPTGILVAERTLFLPSVGAAILAGSLAAAVAERTAFAAAALALVVGLGAARSWSRQAVWRDNPTLFGQTLIDAPTSYRSYFVAGKELQREGKNREAAGRYREAARLFTGDSRVYEEWGQVLRIEGHCDEAIPVLDAGVKRHPMSTLARSRLFECLLDRGRMDEARRIAKAGVALGLSEFTQSLTRVDRKAAERAAKAPGTS